jgi:GNAT superfamily N-acetyltransferase
MSKIRIPLAEIDDAEALKDIITSAFKVNFEKYGHNPPGIESVEWHRDQIWKGNYHKINFDDNLVGGIYLKPYPNQEMKIEYFFISPEYQNKKIGAMVMGLVEEKYEEIDKWFLVTPYKDFRNHYFYEKLGYKRVGELRPDENSDFKLFQYEKEINCP